jgi:hypothetical protein
MFKDIFSKYFSNLLILLTVVGIALFAYDYYRDKAEQRKYANLIGTKEKYEQLNKYTAKLESDYKSQKDLIEKANKEFADFKKDANERIKLLSDATYLIGKHVEKQNGPDYYFETPKRTRNYLLNEIRLQGKDSPAIGYIMIKHDGRTYKRNYTFDINVKNLQTIDESTGKVKVVSKVYLIQKEVSPLTKRVEGYDDWANRPYPLEITGGVAYIDPTKKNTTRKFHLWAPHINGGFNIGSSELVKGAVDASLAGYGISKNDLKWKFVHLGFDFDSEFKNMGFHITPASYRIFDTYITNTYIGPGIGWDNKGTNFYLNLNLGF